MSAATSSRKRCELACTLCRRRKIKCLTSVPDRKACDKCVEKGKESECIYLPVADDHPPQRLRQSPPASSYTYASIAPITPTRDSFLAHSSSSASPPADYYNVYSQYPSTSQGSPTHYHQVPSPQMPMQAQHYGYEAPASPTHHVPSSSPTAGYTDNSGVSGMPMADGGLPMMHWNAVPQNQYPIHVQQPVAQTQLWTTNVQDQSEMASYYDPSYTQQPVQTYSQAGQLQHQSYAQYQPNTGSYYTSP